MMSGSSRYPFTASQWQELEHQALIYKYMTSGMPIPSELILHMRRSYLLASTTTSSSNNNSNTSALAYASLPSMGWGCYQMGFGRKAEDPEPGRCRRTDGKKWRCSKEAYPDSKYCERHMHRGKNRSRKHVEMSLTTTTTNNKPTPTTTTTTTTTAAAAAATALPISQPEAYHHLLYPYHYSRPPGAFGFQPLQNNTSHFHQDTDAYSSSDKDYRYAAKDVEEYSFHSEGSRGRSWEFMQLGMSSLGEQKNRSLFHQGGNSFTTDVSKEEQQQHCFVLGTDFKLEKPEGKQEREEAAATRHFFDEWPQGGSNQASKTQLSISTPMSHHDFPVAGSRYRDDD